MDEHREANRALWNAWTPINLASKFYDVEAFAAGRGGDLDPIARAGPGDVRGKSLLHLQCHFGMDTIRWANHGAVVTGVDFSEEAIAAARALAARMGVAATFVHSDLYELPAKLEGRFDVVFTSHGVLNWLPDLERWARVIAHFLAPGGIFYIVEAHPVLNMFNDRLTEPDLRLLYPYFHGPEPILEEHRGCYTAADAPITSVEHVWLHKLSDIIGSLARAGLRIASFEEYPFLSWPFFPWMERGADGWWRLPAHPGVPLGRGSLPLMFSLKATLTS
ncbi:MAG TPA: class I SAM-dependent methyltransferase [Methylomirabilota bacterium]|jgi:SAM-dependent methyltransferase